MKKHLINITEAAEQDLAETVMSGFQGSNPCLSARKAKDFSHYRCEALGFFHQLNNRHHQAKTILTPGS